MGSKGSTTTKSSSSLPPEFLTGYTNALKMAGQAVGTPYQPYQGQLVAGLNPTQLQGISNVNSAQGMALPAIQRGMDLTSQAAKGITPELYNQFYSPYVRDVADATQKNLMESNAQQMSGLKGNAIQAGAFGGDRGGVAQAEMARQQDLATGQTMANVYNQGYGQAMGLAGQQAQNYGAMGQQMAGLGLGAQSSVLQGAQAEMAAGSQQQSTEQAQLSAAYDQYMQQQSYPYQQAQFYANIAEGLGSTAGGNSSTTTPGPSWGSQVLGGLGAIGSIFSSDERLKTDIEPIGELFDGQKIYRYRFKDEPHGTTRIGLMAQDVQRHNPGAVREINGIKGVDYRAATNDAASSGGLVPPGAGRMGFADGGVPFYPWADARGWVPEGKIERGSGPGMPKPPDKYDPQGLDQSWGDLKPLSADQLKGLDNVRLKLGISLPRDNADPVIYARGGLARAHYASGGSPAMAPALIDTSGSGLAPAAPALPTNSEVDAYVAQAAKARGIDPDVAVRLWHAEGRSGNPAEAWRSKAILKDGQRENSYGPLQLNVKNGVGAQMIKDTGVDPSKVENWKPSVDYGLDHAKQAGWNDWMGAKAIGLAPRQGLPPVDGQGSSGISPASDPNPTSDGGAPVPSSGLVIPGQKPGFSLSGLFAGDGNPNLIERVMGHQMSPEARNAVMAASFAALAGRSPYMGVNIGEAGKVGMETYYNALKQKADVANTLSEARLRGVQGTVAEQELYQQRYSLYQMAKANNYIQNGPAAPFMSFVDWEKKYNFPIIGGDGGDGSSGAPAADDPSKAPITGQTLAPPPGVDQANTGGGGPHYKVQPLGSPTVLADPGEGPDPTKDGTLPNYLELQKRFQAAAMAAGNGNIEQMKEYNAVADQYAARANTIMSSDAYKNKVTFDQQYQRTLSGLEKLAKINSTYTGGRLAEEKAEIVGVLQGMGVPLPKDWANETADFDMTMKGAMTLALNNASQLGVLAHAPASLMDAEGRVIPDAKMDPVARYDIIRRAIADLHFNHDMYATWDQSPNFAQHQSEFNQKSDYNNYLDFATKNIPTPSVHEGEEIPGKTQPQVAPEKEIQRAISQLTSQLGDAPIGTDKYAQIGGVTVHFTKTKAGWRMVQ